MTGELCISTQTGTKVRYYYVRTWKSQVTVHSVKASHSPLILIQIKKESFWRPQDPGGASIFPIVLLERSARTYF